MSYCPECGSEVANHDTFCAYCGISLQAIAEPPVSETPQPENAPIMGEPEKIQTSASLDKEKPSEIEETQPESTPVTPPTPFILEETESSAAVAQAEEEVVESPQPDIAFQPSKTAEQIIEKTGDYNLQSEVAPEIEEIKVEEPISQVITEEEKSEPVSISKPEFEAKTEEIPPTQIEDIDEFSQTLPYSSTGYDDQDLVSPEAVEPLLSPVSDLEEEDKLKSVLDEIDSNLQIENNLAVQTPAEIAEDKSESFFEQTLADEEIPVAEVPPELRGEIEEPQEVAVSREALVEEKIVEERFFNEPIEKETAIPEAVQMSPDLAETPISQSAQEIPVAQNELPFVVVSSDGISDSKEGRSFTNPIAGDGDTGGRSKQKLKPLDEGTILNNRYEVIRKIGGGGMGAVYLANDKNLGGVLRAVKEMVQSYIEDEAQVKAVSDFKRESLLLTSLEHPGIPTIYDYFFDEKEGRFYLVMKYISGGDLAARLRAAPEGRVDEVSVTDWAIQIADVLDYLHNRQPPIVYRDLKPSNIMIDGNTGKVMIIDFGIARWVNKEEKGVTAVGTMGYAPPELFSGNVEPRSDIYSLGSTMFHLLTGADPQSNPLLIFDFNKNPRPRQINPSLSDQMEQILMRAVEYNSDQRFTSAAEMRDELGKHLQNLRKGTVTFGVVTSVGAGQPLSNVPVFCGFCGQKIVATDMFCPFCGAQQPLVGQSQKLQPTPAVYIAPVVTAKLLIVGTNEFDRTEYALEKDNNLLGRRDPMSNIFPEVDMSKFDPQTKISRKHARIWREGDMFMLEDLGSSNGTILIMSNNESVRLLPRQPHVLSHGDKLKLGDTTLRFTIG